MITMTVREWFIFFIIMWVMILLTWDSTSLWMIACKGVIQ